MHSSVILKGSPLFFIVSLFTGRMIHTNQPIQVFLPGISKTDALNHFWWYEIYAVRHAFNAGS